MQSLPRGRGRGRTTGGDRGRGQGTARGRGSDRLHSRGHPNSRPPHPRDPDSQAVPWHSSIHPGAGVSVILKADQPSGHQVCGIVADLLTRGDHPRGVKVRLRDGRVGRVQKLVSADEGSRGENLVGGASADLGRNGAEGNLGRFRGGRVERDIREEDAYLYDDSRPVAADEGLFRSLEEADRRHQDEAVRRVTEGEILNCPVCGEFEGDEPAVARHVDSHFGE